MNPEIYTAVKSTLVDALGVDAEEVSPDKTILGDLGAESIDLLDILFRLERKLGIKVKVSDIAHHIQGGIPDEEFADEHGIINAVGLAQIKTALPQIDPEALVGKLEAENVLSLFTVENLVTLVGKHSYADVQ
ncbi:acyl carrier protein [Tengunoibacter tsumagoiensis]|uniref:Acyl carrier protein n=1 Tax=Tengunoibacter tsumagoiensis TaxID=2014871 RepID=A0A402A7G0_9CHLR|nr:phosphopantetheine-binding protein [Tengunoibacter tsumagoiensis]GCE14916.1 acyl carrier protein [Tengunoibacter tsumagoiensis]